MTLAFVAALALIPLAAFAGGSPDEESAPVKVSRSASVVPYIRLLDPVTGRPLWLPVPLVKTSSTPQVSQVRPQVFSKPGPVPTECQDPALSAQALVMLERLGVCPTAKTSTRL